MNSISVSVHKRTNTIKLNNPKDETINPSKAWILIELIKRYSARQLAKQ